MSLVGQSDFRFNSASLLAAWWSERGCRSHSATGLCGWRMAVSQPSLMDLLQRVKSGDSSAPTALELVDAARSFTSALLQSSGNASGRDKGKWLWDTIVGLYETPPAIVFTSQALFLSQIEEKPLAIKKLVHCLELYPRHFPALESLESLRDSIIDRWHFYMLNDRRRNFAYQQAIERALQLRPEAMVLDIGGVSSP